MVPSALANTIYHKGHNGFHKEQQEKYQLPSF
jgi:hypothetical protein